MLKTTVQFILFLTTCLISGCSERGNTESQTFSVELETITKGNEKEYTWTHARSAVIPSDKPRVLTTMSQTLKEGSDVYHDLYQVISHDMGQTWSTPEAIPSLTIIEQDSGYRSVVDMWPKWHSGSDKVVNIGTSPFILTKEHTTVGRRR